MILTEADLLGAFLVDLDRLEDDRGFFARTWCADEFRERGLNPNLAQCSISFNRRKGTIRGMHWQAEPHGEAKLVRCTRGAIRDVIVDIRPHSTSFRRWFAVQLDADNHRALYVPEGFAHGFETLTDASEILYQISVPYVADSTRGFVWNDPDIAIDWLTADPIISDRDRSLPKLSAAPIPPR